LLPTTFCPSVAYATPFLSAPAIPTQPLTSLPDNITSLLTSNLNAISTSLLSTACGRDRYSYTSSCADCYSAYRDWLCRILLPQCGTDITTSSTPAPQTMRRTSPGTQPGGDNESYDELLPCLSTCNAVDRACPVNLNFRCPLRKHGAERSYAFVGNGPGYGDGSSDQEVPSRDRWGNVWCNG
jgi:calcium channel MID1